MCFYVYIYYTNSIPFYVGKGCNGRVYQHLYGKGRNKHLVNKIRKIQKETGKDPEIRFFMTNISESLAFDLERYLIRFFGRKDKGLGPLLNLTDGGDGVSGYICTEDDRRGRSERARGPRKPLSEEHKKKISDANKGKPRGLAERWSDPDFRKRIIAARIGQRRSEETKFKMSQAHKRLWKSPEFREREIPKALKKLHIYSK